MEAAAADGANWDWLADCQCKHSKACAHKGVSCGGGVVLGWWLCAWCMARPVLVAQPGVSSVQQSEHHNDGYWQIILFIVIMPFTCT
jgi:hypothetical protein